jgi:VWFA-related protein
MKNQMICASLASLILALVPWAYSQAQSGTAVQPAAEQKASASQEHSEKKTELQETPKTIYESATVLKAITRLVVVDVVATNSKGEPITDLTANDFTVLENGTPQQLRFFSFQSGGNAVAFQPSPSRRLPTNVFTNVPDYKPTGALNVILLDALNTSLLHQVDVQEQMVKLLEKLPSDRPMAVYALGEKLQLLQDFTSDPALLQKSIEQYKGRSSSLLANPSGGPESELYGGRSGGISKVFVLGMISAQSDVRAFNTMDALNSLARTLAAYPGRKNLIWVSETFPLYVNSDTTISGVHADSIRNYDLEVAKTADALMNAQVAVYSIHTRGMTGIDFFKAGNNGFDAFGHLLTFYMTAGPIMQQASSDLSDNLLAAHTAMDDLAERTGGKAFYNTNDFGKAVRSSMDDGSTYYTLGYYPKDKQWNGKFRKLKLKVAHSNAKLRYRLGYFAIDPSTGKKDPGQGARDFSQALSLDYPVSTAVLFEAGVVPPSAKTHNKILVNYLIDAHAISFQKEKDGLQHALLDCAAQIYSEKGAPLKTEATSITAALTPEIFRQVMQNNLPCQVTFDLPPGKYTLRLGIRDNHTGLVGSVNAQIAVPVQEARQNSLPQN